MMDGLQDALRAVWTRRTPLKGTPAEEWVHRTAGRSLRLPDHVGYLDLEDLPYLVAAVARPDGAFDGFHIASCLDDWQAAYYPETGSAIRLGEPADVLGIASNLALGLRARSRFAVPVWVSPTEHAADIVIPDSVKHIILFSASYWDEAQFQRGRRRFEFVHADQLAAA